MDKRLVFKIGTKEIKELVKGHFQRSGVPPTAEIDLFVHVDGEPIRDFMLEGQAVWEIEIKDGRIVDPVEEELNNLVGEK